MSEESNQIKWVGIRPISEQSIFQSEPGPWAAVRGGVSRSQICKDATCNSSIEIVHGVTSGKTLFITSAQIGGNGGESANYYIDVANGEGAQQFRILCGYCSSTAGFHVANCFPMPILVPSGYLVRVQLSSGPAAGSIQGWEE
jgi:hypothetical protein